MARDNDYDWHEFGRQAGQAAVGGSVVELNVGSCINPSDGSDWLNGVIDGAEGSGKQIRLIRINSAHKAQMRLPPAITFSEGTYRQYDFACNEHLAPGNSIQVDFD